MEFVSLRLAGQKQVVMGVFLLVTFSLGGCASWQAPETSDDAALRARAVMETVQDVTLSAAVLGADDSLQLFGTDINGNGIQPIWIEVRNNSAHTLWLLRSGTDPSYYSPLEVAWPLHTRFATKSNSRVDAYYNALDFKSPVPPGSTRSGILFVNPHKGMYVLNVDLLGQQTVYPFTLFLPIPGEYDHSTAETLARLAKTGQYNYQDTESFRNALEQLPCCTSGGDPANMIFVGSLNDVGAALIRRGYRADRNESDARQLIYDRPPDIVLRKSGQGGVPANWIRIWVTPMLYLDQPVLLVQSGRPQGGRFAVAMDEEQKLHPNVDESRNLQIQDLMYSGGLAQLGYVGGVGAVSKTLQESPDSEIHYYTDGLRAVLFFVTRPLAMSDIKILDWVPYLQQREAEATANHTDK